MSDFSIILKILKILRDFVFDATCPGGARGIEDEISQNPLCLLLFNPRIPFFSLDKFLLRRHTPRGCILEIIQISTISMIFLDFARKTCDSTSGSDIFASRRSMINFLIPRDIYIFQRFHFFDFFFASSNFKC